MPGRDEAGVLIAMVADKGAPGVTTSALVLALGWPAPVLLAECDPAGADLPWWVAGAGGRPLAQGTGVVSLAMAGRGATGAERRVWEHVQHLEGGLPVLVGPPGPEQAEAMGGAWQVIADQLAGPRAEGSGEPDMTGEVHVVVDCGRLLSRSSPAAAVVQRADLVVVVTRPTVSGVAHARHGVGVAARVLNDSPRAGSGLDRVAVVVVDDPSAPGSRKTHERQVGVVIAGVPGLQDVPVLGVLAHDPRTAAALTGRAPLAPRNVHRSPLLRTARQVAKAVMGRVDELDTVQARS